MKNPWVAGLKNATNWTWMVYYLAVIAETLLGPGTYLPVGTSHYKTPTKNTATKFPTKIC
jgi:hypothetical protein